MKKLAVVCPMVALYKESDITTLYRKACSLRILNRASSLVEMTPSKSKITTFFGLHINLLR